MLTLSRLNGFVAVVDTAKAKAFYAGMLGLPIIEETAHGLVFDTNGAKLFIQKVDQIHVHAHTICGWEVKDIETTAADLAAEGVVFERYDGMGQDAMRIWTGPDGARVAWFKDPQGNTLSLTQFPPKK